MTGGLPWTDPGHAPPVQAVVDTPSVRGAAVVAAEAPPGRTSASIRPASARPGPSRRDRRWWVGGGAAVVMASHPSCDPAQARVRVRRDDPSPRARPGAPLGPAGTVRTA